MRKAQLASREDPVNTLRGFPPLQEEGMDAAERAVFLGENRPEIRHNELDYLIMRKVIRGCFYCLE